MIRTTVTLIVIFACVFSVGAAGPIRSFDIEKLNIKVGMKRSELERNISKYAELKSNYSAQYPTETSTNATYVIKTINLSVKYKEGMPAPYITNNDGSITHLPAIEQTVISWGINY